MKTLKSLGMLLLIALGLYVLVQGTSPKNNTKGNVSIMAPSRNAIR